MLRNFGRAKSRPLTLERLESREVPAFVSALEIPVQTFNNSYDVIEAPGQTLLVAAADGVRGNVLRLDWHGKLVETIRFTPAAGRPTALVNNLSEDGRWAVGFSTFLTVNADPSVLTLWRLNDPQSPIALDFVDMDRFQWRAGAALSDIGTFSTTTADGTLLLVSAQGVTELALPPDGSREWASHHGFVAGISRAGDVLAGATMPPPLEGAASPPHGVVYRATVWRNLVPELLEVPPGTISSRVYGLSDDGSLIGGSVFAEGLGTAACVWVDGQLQLLETQAGHSMQGHVEFLVRGIGGDPGKWLAFGNAYNTPGFIDVTFVAGPDGVAIPFSQWLRQQHGFSGQDFFTDVGLADVLLVGDQLRLFTAASVAIEFRTFPSLVMPAQTPKMITIDLEGTAIPSDPPDVNQDGRVSVLDLLSVINAITLHGTGPIDSSSGEQQAADVNHDASLSVLDVLTVVNYLTQQRAAGLDSPPPIVAEMQERAISLAAPPKEQSALFFAVDQLCEELAARRRQSAMPIGIGPEF